MANTLREIRRVSQHGVSFYFRRLYRRVFDIPSGLGIDTSARCNLRCTMCSLEEHGAKKTMSLDTFDRLLPVFPWLQYISLVCTGEPLMNKGFWEMVGKLRRVSSAHLILTTNMMLLDKTDAENIVKFRVNEVVISVDGATPAMYEGIRTGAKFERLETAIRILKEACDKLATHKPRLTICFVSMKDNVVELPNVVSLAARWGVSTVSVNGVEPYSERLRHQILYDGSIADYQHCIVEAERRARSLGITLTLPWFNLNGKRHCEPVPHVSWDGFVRPCDALMYTRPFFFLDQLCWHHALDLGNVYEKPLLDIWRSRDVRRFRERVISGAFPPSCDHCLFSYNVICPLR